MKSFEINNSDVLNNETDSLQSNLGVNKNRKSAVISRILESVLSMFFLLAVGLFLGCNVGPTTTEIHESNSTSKRTVPSTTENGSPAEPTVTTIMVNPTCNHGGFLGDSHSATVKLLVRNPGEASKFTLESEMYIEGVKQRSKSEDIFLSEGEERAFEFQFSSWDLDRCPKKDCTVINSLRKRSY